MVKPTTKKAVEKLRLLNTYYRGSGILNPDWGLNKSNIIMHKSIEHAHRDTIHLPIFFQKGC